VFGPRNGLYTVGVVRFESTRATSMHACDDEAMVNRIGGTDLVVTCDGAGLVDAISTCGESRSRVVEGNRCCRQGVSKSVMSFL